MKKTDQKYKVTCPECGKNRVISYAAYRFIVRGEASGRCQKCGIIHRDAVIADVKESITPIMPYVDFAGCRLSEVWIGKWLNSSRCEKYCKCAKSSECLDRVIEEGWKGFTSDCKGFQKRGEFE